MNETISILIPGDPIAKKRPRFARRGKFVTTYSDQETEESKFYMLAKEQIKTKLSGPLAIRMTFCIKRPKSHYGTGKNSCILKDTAPSFPDKKPDFDNLCKFACDVLNGLAWDDDAQIVEAIVKKRYTDKSYSVIVVSPMELAI
jgi:Holliday junction resolvase RusA-like endonuclease